MDDADTLILGFNVLNLLLIGVAVALRWWDPAPDSMTGRKVLVYIALIISTFLGAFLYFRANFPH